MGLAFSLALVDLISYYKKDKQNERKNIEQNLNKDSTTTHTFSKPPK